MKQVIACITLFFLFFSGGQNKGRTTLDFNFDWKFCLGDEAAWSAPGLDDSGWRALHLPHDWSIEGEFSSKNPAGVNGGALPGGIGWYRKHFRTPEAERVAVEFDGVYMNSTVWVNGKEVGGRPYGYSSFCLDITPALN
ncbi:MAG: glycoside hydrolase family 2, partial [Bacteroidales bacterium]|nr:glycoside hydrolase family 2 [Bacteroidales bacterium]